MHSLRMPLPIGAPRSPSQPVSSSDIEWCEKMAGKERKLWEAGSRTMSSHKHVSVANKMHFQEFWKL